MSDLTFQYASVGLCAWLLSWGCNRIYLIMKNLVS